MIELDNLSMVYPGGVKAVNNVSFKVGEGEIFGLLGPNGAGKSTIIMILTTLLVPTGGTASIGGVDIKKNPYGVRQKLGYISQDLAVDDHLTGIENLFLQANFYHLPKGQIKQRCVEALKLVGLEERASDRVETYSGGMRKRLDIATGLLHEPQVLFLDEPTLGLDIQTRQQIWKYIEYLQVEKKMTIILTTHYMEEADILCDRIGIIDRGEIRVIDTPKSLKAILGGDVLTLAFNGDENQNKQRAIAAMENLSCVNSIVASGDNYTVLVKDGEKAIPLLFQILNGEQVGVESLTFKKPTLADVYLHFTGQALRDESWNREQAFKSVAMRKRIRG